MFFAKKLKGFFVELGEQSILLARASQIEAPLVVEELKEFPASDTAAFKDYLKGAVGRGPTGYAHARCGIYPTRRIVRRHTVDPKRAKEPAYFNEIYSQQFRIEPEKYAIQALNPEDGSEYDSGKGAPKEALFCGLPSDEIISTQSSLLEMGLYPERLELGTVATAGALASYLSFKQSKTPVLLLEMGTETTHSHIVSADGMDVSRPIPSGIAAMIPVVQKELGLKDEESAKKLFYSNTFDFTSMGGTLVKKLLKELQSSIGFYEVQTGQSIGSVLCTQLPASLGWLGTTIASSLGVGMLKMELVPWLESQSITLTADATPNPPDERWLGLLALMPPHYNAAASAATDQKK